MITLWLNNKQIHVVKIVTILYFFWKESYFFLFENFYFLKKKLNKKKSFSFWIKTFLQKKIPYYLLIDLLFVLQLHIPHFCFEKTLSISGNCRMCLIEIEKNLKPISSCTYNLYKNILFYSWLPSLQKSRENILEFLLQNHPLDCPICDQGGECDLQDLTLLWSNHKARFFFFQKKTFQNFFLTKIINTSMNKCIQCTRCIRFLREILTNTSLGILFRTVSSEINLYVQKSFEQKQFKISNLLNIFFYLNVQQIWNFFSYTNLFFLAHSWSNNLIMLCPVGAFTSKIYQAIFRSWDLEYLNFYTLFEANAPLIFLNLFNGFLIRILNQYTWQLNHQYLSNTLKSLPLFLNLTRNYTFYSIYFSYQTKYFLSFYSKQKHMKNIQTPIKLYLFLQKYFNYCKTSFLILLIPLISLNEILYFSFFSQKKYYLNNLLNENINFVENWALKPLKFYLLYNFMNCYLWGCLLLYTNYDLYFLLQTYFNSIVIRIHSNSLYFLKKKINIAYWLKIFSNYNSFLVFLFSYLKNAIWYTVGDSFLLTNGYNCFCTIWLKSQNNSHMFTYYFNHLNDFFFLLTGWNMNKKTIFIAQTKNKNFSFFKTSSLIFRLKSSFLFIFQNKKTFLNFWQIINFQLKILFSSFWNFFLKKYVWIIPIAFVFDKKTYFLSNFNQWIIHNLLWYHHIFFQLKLFSFFFIKKSHFEFDWFNIQPKLNNLNLLKNKTNFIIEFTINYLLIFQTFFWKLFLNYFCLQTFNKLIFIFNNFF